MKLSDIVQGVFMALITGLLAVIYEANRDLAADIRAQSIMITRNAQDIAQLDDKFDRVDTKTVLNRVVIAELEAKCERWIKDVKKQSDR